ncbi:hypothetical protein [Candidatus Electronema sp. PJ]|uniref:hypothetical protein n=1 Tax=Candidatus Electronema sp. PJ TaxID=3401572 RepID=UPI003AA866EB
MTAIKKWIILEIKVMTVVGIIATIIAAVFVLPNMEIYEYGANCTATVNDVGAIGGALEDYFANPANVTATTLYNPYEGGRRPFILVGADNTGAYKSNTLLLSASTTMPGVAQGVPRGDNWGGPPAAGAFRAGSNYVVYACEGEGLCPKKITSSDTHWINDPISQIPCKNSYCCYFKTL